MVLALIVVVCMLGYVYWNLNIQKTDAPKSSEDGNEKINIEVPESQIEKIQYEDAKADRYSGDYDSAIKKLNTIIGNTTDPDRKGLSKIFLAESLYLRAQGDDIAQGLRMYTELANDKSVSARVRASALNGLAGIVVSNDAAFYKTYFYEAPFSDLYQENVDKQRAILDTYYKILELSDKISPNSFAKYSIAGDYYAMLLFNGQIKQEDATKVATQMLQYIKDGDALRDDALYSSQANMVRALYRALGLSVAGKALNQKPEEREIGFRSALSLVQESENVDNSQSVKFWSLKIRFYYANFLISSYGQERNESIKTLLQKFGSLNNEEAFYKNIQDFFLSRKDPGRAIHARIVLLSEVSPEFKQFLTKINFF